MGNPIHQILVNYQNGVNREIQNAGNPNGNGNGGNGAMRILIIDPDNDIVHTETYFVELDKFLSGSRGDPTPSRDGMGNRPEADDGSNNIQLVVFGTTSKLGFAPIPGDDGSAEIIALPFFNPQNGLRVEPGFAPAGGGRLYETYTLIWDVFIPVVIGLTSILQTDLTNNSDGDFWIQRDSEGNGLIGADSQVRRTSCARRKVSRLTFSHPAFGSFVDRMMDHFSWVPGHVLWLFLRSLINKTSHTGQTNMSMEN
jgi:hypothetical protein